MKILFVTATRADYGKQEPLALAASEAGHKVSFFITGMHMFEKYGYTKYEVTRNSSFGVVEYVNQREGDNQDIILSKTIVGFSDYIEESKPDLIVIHGDRIESLACSLVASINSIPCAHVEGGEVSGTIDEVFRHCNTKLSNIHLVSSKKAKQRVLKLGETEDSIYIIGSPELDIHSEDSGVSFEEVKDRYKISSEDLGIFIFHPVTSEKDSIGAQARSVLDELKKSNKYFVVILPNNDPGEKEILNHINQLPSNNFRIIPSMRFRYFSELMKNSKVIIGNSSLGVREAPFLGIPSLDIGTRQTNRSEAKSVSKCSAYEKNKIKEFIKIEWGKRYERDFEFGKGMAKNKFVEILSDSEIYKKNNQKYFRDN